MFVFFGLFLSFFGAGFGYQCIDDNGKPVDWFVAYKLPLLKASTDFYQRRGLAYIYITSTQPSVGWRQSFRSVNDSLSMMARTLSPLYDNTNVIKLVYNDQPPNSTASSAYGHTKGVVVADVDDGFWLVHSVPRFPQTGNFAYPTSATRFGQSFLCISLPAAQIDAVGTQLMYNRPKIYLAHLVDGLREMFPKLSMAGANEFVKKGPWTSKVFLKSLAGVSFTSYAKTGAFDSELYAAWVAPDLRSDLRVEAWSNGVGELPSNCTSKYHVMDVSDIGFKLNKTGIHFKNSMDHSKWAVGGANQKYVCIGDINRMAAQLLRGGGTVCFKNTNVWNAYSKMVEAVQPCPRTLNNI